MRQSRSNREGGWPFAHGAALQTALTCTQTEETMRERGMLARGRKSHAESSLRQVVFYGESHTFFRLGAVLITVLVGVSKAVFLLVGRYEKGKEVCFQGKVSCYVGLFNIWLVKIKLAPRENGKES